MSKDWETEDDEVQIPTTPARPSTPTHLVFEVKASLVLVDSDKESWGIVEDTLNNLAWEPGKGEVVGTWSRPKYDNLIHISLATSIAALQDRSIQTFAQYAEERRQQKLGVKKPSKRAKKAGEPMQEQAPVQDISFDEKMKFNALRARLGRAK
ncbi:hypothetical protein MUP59_01795 [Candidatus Bathyarchaeota archaeon]|nr:hypothetical protein [Candidatus Bathyarchaeota archaeon]